MAEAWITEILNNTPRKYTVNHRDSVWHACIDGKQVGRSQMNGKETDRFEIPPRRAPGEASRIEKISYCSVPWHDNDHCLRVTGPNGHWVEFEVGRFSSGDDDDIRVIDSAGKVIGGKSVRLGPLGPKATSCSYEFKIRIDDKDGFQLIPDSISTGVGPQALRILNMIGQYQQNAAQQLGALAPLIQALLVLPK